MRTKYIKVAFKILLIMILFLNTIGIKSFALVEQSKEFYVNDTANLLDSEVENYIIETNKKLNAATGAQICVVTVKNLEGQSLEEYATALFRKYGIGDKNKNNGVLLLLALDERKFRIEVGYGLEGALPDGKTGRIQDDYIIPYLKDNNWNEGVRNGYSKVLQEVSNEYGVDVGNINITEPENSDDSIGSAIFIVAITILSPILFSAKRKVRIGILIGDIIAGIITIICAGFEVPGINSILGSLISLEVIIFMMSIFGIIALFVRGNGSRWRILRRWLVFWWRRFFWRRRFFWWRRFFKRFLNINVIKN